MKFKISILLLATMLGQSSAFSQVKAPSTSTLKTVSIKDGIPQCQFRYYLNSITLNGNYDDSFYPDDEPKISIRNVNQGHVYDQQGYPKFVWDLQKELVVKSGKEYQKMYLTKPAIIPKFKKDMDDQDFEFLIQEENGVGAYETIVPSKPRGVVGSKLNNGVSTDASAAQLEEWEALKMRPKDFGRRDRSYSQNNSDKYGDKLIWKTKTEIEFQSWESNEFLNDEGEEQSWAPDKTVGPEVSIIKVSNCSLDQVKKYVQHRNDQRDANYKFSDDRHIQIDGEGNTGLSDIDEGQKSEHDRGYHHNCDPKKCDKL